MLNFDAIGDLQIVNCSSGRLERLRELVTGGACVIAFLGRWGCSMGRLWAQQLSEIAPLLREHNVRLIGVGVDEVGIEQFISGKFFDGEIYQDYLKRTYDALNFKRFNYLSFLASQLSRESRSAKSKAHKLKLGGDLKGDLLQSGGLLIIDENSQILLEFRQNQRTQYVKNEEILRILNIQKNSSLNENISEENTQEITEESQTYDENIQDETKEIPTKTELLKEDLERIEKVELHEVSEASGNNNK